MGDDIVWPAWKHAAACQGGEGVANPSEHTDEVQYSVSKDMVRFETFQTEDEAKVAGKPGSSAIGHAKRFYRAYSPMADVIKDSIETIVQFLNINVALGFEWQLGRDWKECH